MKWITRINQPFEKEFALENGTELLGKIRINAMLTRGGIAEVYTNSKTITVYRGTDVEEAKDAIRRWVFGG